MFTAAALLCALVCATPAHAAWKPEPASYGVSTTKNVPITMKDGTVLRADVHYPADPKTGKPAAGKFPVIVTETAYGKDFGQYGAPINPALAGGTGFGYSEYLIKRGYIQALVDVRGTGGSGGEWEFNEPIEAQDSKTVINWAAKLPRSTGKVGMVGLSYLGITQLFAAAEVGKNSPLKAIMPMASDNDMYREAITSGGIFNVETVSGYLGATAALAAANPAISNNGDPEALLTAMADHVGGLIVFHAPLTLSMVLGGDRAFDGDYWQARSPANVLKKVVANGVPAYLVGGLYDAFQIGQPMNFTGLQNAWAGRPTTSAMSPKQKVSGRYQLMMGPWYHTTFGIGKVDLNALQLAWFDRWLKNEPTGITRTKTPLHIYDPDYRHVEAKRFPLENATPETMPLGTGTIAFTGASQPCSRSTETWMLGLGEAVLQTFGLTDYCGASELLPPGAPGQLEFTSEAFTRKRLLAGPIAARINATSTTKDVMLVATVSDVGPDGKARTLTEGALLGSNRALDAKRTWRTKDGRILLPYHPYTSAASQPVTPGQSTTYDIQIAPTFATIAPGHRIKVTLASSNFPHLLPTAPQLANLAGGIYTIEPGSSVVLPFVG